MKIIYILFAITLSLFAKDAIVSVDWLNKNLNSDKIKIVEVSNIDSYLSGHIPNAVHTSIDKWRSNNGTYLTIRSIKEIESEISSLGIDNNTHVIIYAPIKTPKDFLKASYVYWALDYHGIKNISLLDGGLNAWKTKKLPLSNKRVKVKSTLFKASIDSSKIADLSYVKEHIGKVPMIDARPSDKYLGITPTATVKRNGHIKGAMSYSWNYSVDENYILKSKDELESLFRDGYGFKKDKEIIVYCTGGLETSFNYYVLSGLLGYTNIRLYDASMKEWGNREDTPMSKYKYEMF